MPHCPVLLLIVFVYFFVLIPVAVDFIIWVNLDPQMRYLQPFSWVIPEDKYLKYDFQTSCPTMWAMVNADYFLGSHWNSLGRIRVKKNSANEKRGRALGSINSRCSRKCARTHPTAERASITSHTRSIGHASSRLSSGRIKDRTRETAEIEPSVAPRDYKGDREGIPHIHPIS